MAPTHLVALLSGNVPLDGIQTGIQAAIGNAIDHWLASHRLLHWLINHPLSTIGLGLLSLFLLAGLIGAIGRLGEQLWLRLLRSPVTLISSLFSGLSQALRRATPTPEPDRLGEILDRLEELRQEESVLLEELRQWVKNDRL